MKREYISDSIGNISTRHIQEAESYEPSQKKGCILNRPFGRAIVAAVLVICFVAAGIGVFSPFNGMVVTAYAHGTDEEITAAGAVINTGTISDTGEMTGHPLMFHLSGKDIETVRFSCKNQQINFMDWTEKRDEFGNAQNFTVSYGEDSSEYYYLLIDWIPDGIIRELTDNSESTIATLPDELREDIIVMEITFANGKTATKAITVSLLDDGSFFASFDDYKIKETDDFVKRTDSVSIPRDILYAQGDSLAGDEEYPFGDAPVVEGDYKDADPNAPEDVVIPGSITFTGTVLADHDDKESTILVEADKGTDFPYETVVFALTEENRDWANKTGTHVEVVCSDVFQESLPPIGSLIAIKAVNEN